MNARLKTEASEHFKQESSAIKMYALNERFPDFLPGAHCNSPFHSMTQKIMSEGKLTVLYACTPTFSCSLFLSKPFY